MLWMQEENATYMFALMTTSNRWAEFLKEKGDAFSAFKKLYLQLVSKEGKRDIMVIGI